MRALITGLVAACLLLPIAATAQTNIPSLEQTDRRGEIGRAAQKKAVERFDAADADKDEKLSREEVTAHSEYMASQFAELDKNGDGFLSWEEFIGHSRWKKE
jgi:hypothetical protein